MAGQRGFTMLELLTTISIIALIVSLGVPSLVSTVRGNRISGYTNELVATIYAARSEAMNEVVQVTVCKSADQASCDAGASWHDGWIMFIDNNENEVRDGGETLLYTHDAVKSGNTLQSASFGDWIAFRPNGLAIGSTANAGTFSVCHESGSYGRDISITRTGSSAVAPSADGSCP